MLEARFGDADAARASSSSIRFQKERIAAVRQMEPDRFEIRKAKRKDLPAIVRLLADDPLGAARERPALPLARQYLAAFADMDRQDGNDLFILTNGEDLLACLQLTIIAGISRLGAKRAQIEAVRVSNHWRGRGLGERLVRHAIEHARAEGCSLVQLTTDRSRPDAHRFYEKLGFEPSHIGMKLAL